MAGAEISYGGMYVDTHKQLEEVMSHCVVHMWFHWMYG